MRRDLLFATLFVSLVSAPAVCAADGFNVPYTPAAPQATGPRGYIVPTRAPAPPEPKTMTAQIFWLEGARDITLETNEPPVERSQAVYEIASPSEQELRVFLEKLRQADVIRTNSSTTFMAVSNHLTPIECRSSIVTPQGLMSLEGQFKASALSNRIVRLGVSARELTRDKGAKSRRREVEAGFDLDLGKTLVYRLPREQVGATGYEWLLTVSRGTLSPMFGWPRIDAIADGTSVPTGGVSSGVIEPIFRQPPRGLQIPTR